MSFLYKIKIAGQSELEGSDILKELSNNGEIDSIYIKFKRRTIILFRLSFPFSLGWKQLLQEMLHRSVDVIVILVCECQILLVL